MFYIKRLSGKGDIMIFSRLKAFYYGTLVQEGLSVIDGSLKATKNRHSEGGRKQLLNEDSLSFKRRKCVRTSGEYEMTLVLMELV